MILAAIEATNSDLAVWMACAVFAVVFWNQLQTAMGKHKTPQPLEVRGQTRVATHEELVSLEGRITRLEDTVKEDIKELRNELKNGFAEQQKLSSISRASIYKRLEDIAAGLHRLEGKTDE